MSIANLFRWVPTPKYGKCGGAKRDCSVKKPKNWMDRAFKAHDQELHEASLLVLPKRREEAKKEADERLYIKLKKGDPKKLDWYGRLYRLGALVVFK